MQIFLDTADINEIKTRMKTGLIDGITTNPSLISKTKANYVKVMREILELCSGPVSIEVLADSTNVQAMWDEVTFWQKTFPNPEQNIVIKLPITEAGLRVCKMCSEQKIKTNMTLCFTSMQALLVAKMGATYVSPFIGRLDDISSPGVGLIQDIVKIYKNYEFETKILAASIRSHVHMTEVAIAGAHVATLGSKIFDSLFKHPLTDLGIKIFEQDSLLIEAV